MSSAEKDYNYKEYYDEPRPTPICNEDVCEPLPRTTIKRCRDPQLEFETAADTGAVQFNTNSAANSSDSDTDVSSDHPAAKKGMCYKLYYEPPSAGDTENVCVPHTTLKHYTATLHEEVIDTVIGQFHNAPNSSNNDADVSFHTIRRPSVRKGTQYKLYFEPPVPEVDEGVCVPDANSFHHRRPEHETETESSPVPISNHGSSARKKRHSYKAYYEPPDSGDNEHVSIPRTTSFRYRHRGLETDSDTNSNTAEISHTLKSCETSTGDFLCEEVQVDECQPNLMEQDFTSKLETVYEDEWEMPGDEHEHFETYEEAGLGIGNESGLVASETDGSSDSQNSTSDWEEDSDLDIMIDDADGEDDEEQPPFEKDESLNGAIHANLNLTKAETLLMVMSLVMKHNLSSSALVDLLNMLNEIFGRAVLPASQYLIQKIFLNKLMQFTFHFYCAYCWAFVSSYTKDTAVNIIPCQNCQRVCKVGDLRAGNFFLMSNIKAQLKTLLETEGIAEELKYPTNRQKLNPENLEDIYDGEVYRDLIKPDGPLSSDSNYSYSFNTDGMPIFKSAHYSMWPIYIMVNELPPKLRSDHVVLAGIWFGKTEPRMNIFLEKFVQEGKDLATDGIMWKKTGVPVKSKMYGICCCADAPARASLLNSVQFNGYMGCNICYHPGKAVERVVKYPMDVCDYTERSDEEVLVDMASALDQGRSVRGLKGPTPLINMPYFPLVWGLPPDFMHCVLLGVARQITELWLGSNATNAYYVGSPNVLARINKTLCAMQTPSFVVRMPRAISDRKYWKASEWYNWLLFYCLPCMKNILDDMYISHLVNLVAAIHLLVQKSVSREDINLADTLLFDFVLKMQLLYGENNMTFNVHLLTHLAKSVKMWGPLWTHSCFPFEAANGRVKKLLKGNRGVIMQAMQKYLLLRALPYFKQSYAVSGPVQLFCKNMRETRTRKPTETCGNIQLYGVGSVVNLEEMERGALLACGFDIPQNIVSFRGLSHKGGHYFSAWSQTGAKRNDRIFSSRDGRIGEILKILLIRDTCVVLFKELTLTNAVSFCNGQSGARVSHIKVCTHISDAIHVILATELLGVCLIFEVGSVSYVCFPPTYVALL